MESSFKEKARKVATKCNICSGETGEKIGSNGKIFKKSEVWRKKNENKDWCSSEELSLSSEDYYQKNSLRIERNEHSFSIEIRNARERNRVRAVNEAFLRLRQAVPYIANRSKRVSKLKTLQKALQYINELGSLLEQFLN